MALLVEEEEDDSGVESESEWSMKQRIMRSISRQHSHHDGRRERSESAQSYAPHRASLALESQLSVVTAETEVSVFVSANCF